MSKPWTGKAIALLKDNPYAELIRSVVLENDKLNKKLQLYYAIKADSWQCNKCCHYYSSVKKLVRHRDKEKNCLDPNYRTRNKYATDKGKWFCYFGCEPKFDSTSSLEQHLLGHEPNELKLWGISHQHLQRSTSVLLVDNASEEINVEDHSHLNNEL